VYERSSLLVNVSYSKESSLFLLKRYKKSWLKQRRKHDQRRIKRDKEGYGR
jgi:hypothetical protein